MSEIDKNLYVYYRAPCENASLLQSRVEAMQTEMCNTSGIASALKRRPEAKDGAYTWMEVYFAVPPGFDATLSNAVRLADLSPLIDGERHTEYFMDISSCA
jgi:hypothetical protein